MIELDRGWIKHVDMGDCLNLKIDGLYERFETGLVKKMLQPGHVFVDVGAHIGYYSALAASIVGPSGLVLAFEPSPANVGLLRQNVEEYGETVKVLEMAVADKSGMASLYLSPDNAGDNRLFKTHNWEHLEVEVTTLDDRPELDGRAIDFLKVDVQGYELKVLAGASEILARSHGLVGIIEFWPAGLKLNGMKQRGDFLTALDDLGFNIYAKGAKRRLEIAKPQTLKRVRDHINLIISRERLL